MRITDGFTGTILLLVPFLFTSPEVSGQSPNEFQERRDAVIGKMEPNSVMILSSGEAAGTFNFPRVGGFFYYLTGLNEPDAYLVLHGRSTRPLPQARMGVQPVPHEPEILFIEPVDMSRANWDALGLGIERAKEEMGFKEVRSNDEFDTFFGTLLLENPSVIYMDYERSGTLNGPLTKYEQVFKRARDKGSEINIQSPSRIISPMLRKKSEAELDILRKAVDITAEAQREAMRSIEPGMYEYQLQSIIRHVFRLNGAQGTGFPCIIGSGINSVILHWMENSRKMEDGDIVVVDIGAEYGMYWADITRTIPANGKYSPRQKEIYEIVLKANEEAIKMIAPGVNFEDVFEKANDILAEGMLRIGLIDDKGEFRKYYFHGLGHHIGLLNARILNIGVLEPGMVITIEPGIYIHEEKLGIRIEDDVLVTENGHEVLSASVPKRIPEIENLMNERGMDYKRNLLK